MLRVASLGRRPRPSLSRVSFLVLALTVGSSGAASATAWSNGDEITNIQNDWGDPLSPAAALLVADFNTVYGAAGGVLVGLSVGGFSMVFTDASTVLIYLPAAGANGPLTTNLVDPTSSSSGTFGGEVLALQLNVDFSDAGFLLGASGIPFGDLILENLSLTDLNGLTVRQFLGVDNTALGGGTTTDSILDLFLLTVQLNGSFVEGTPSTFAQDHLVAPTTVPEPSALLLIGLGALGLGWSRRLRRRR